MPTVNLTANIKTNRPVACQALTAWFSHVPSFGFDVTAIVISGAGVVSITYTGAALTAAQKTHLGIA